jgi:CHAT domain-containing protein
MPIKPFEHLVAIYDDGTQPVLETRVLSSPWGTPSQRTGLPYTPEQVDALLKLIERSTFAAADFAQEMPILQGLGWVQEGRLTLPRAELLQQVGRRLYEALFPRGPVRTALNVSLGQARHARAPVAYQLHLDKDAGYLARLPWELLHDDHGYLVQSGRLALARYIAFRAPLTSLAVRGALRVLVVVARPHDLPMLDKEAELSALKASLASLAGQSGLDVDLLQLPTWPSFVHALSSTPYHMVHFDGHGDFGRRCPTCRHLADASRAACPARTGPNDAVCGASLSQVGPRGYLAFERKDGSADWRSAENLAAALFRNCEVRLVVLSACRSATVGSGVLFGGTAPALIGMGVPAVVAMQSEVPLYATVSFAEAFYAALARRRPLSEAVAEARASLDDETWYRPALYLRGRSDPQGTLFEPR